MKNHGAQYNYPTSPTWSSPHLTCISLQLLFVPLVAFVFDAKARLTLNKRDGSGLAIAQWLTIHDWNISVNDQCWVYTSVIFYDNDERYTQQNQRRHIILEKHPPMYQKKKNTSVLVSLSTSAWTSHVNDKGMLLLGEQFPRILTCFSRGVSKRSAKLEHGLNMDLTTLEILSTSMDMRPKCTVSKRGIGRLKLDANRLDATRSSYFPNHDPTMLKRTNSMELSRQSSEKIHSF